MNSKGYTDNCAFSTDGGMTWNLTGQPKTSGAFYGSAISHVEDVAYAFACGPNGIDFTADMGQTWVNLDTLNYWAIGMFGDIGYVAGTEGKILKISLQ